MQVYLYKGMVGSHKVVGSSDSKFLCGLMASIQVIFCCTYHKM